MVEVLFTVLFRVLFLVSYSLFATLLSCEQDCVDWFFLAVTLGVAFYLGFLFRDPPTRIPRNAFEQILEEADERKGEKEKREGVFEIANFYFRLGNSGKLDPFALIFSTLIWMPWGRVSYKGTHSGKFSRLLL